jgi:hypothetical protein
MTYEADLLKVPENVGEHVLNNFDSVKDTLKGRLVQNFSPMNFKKLRAE